MQVRCVAIRRLGSGSRVVWVAVSNVELSNGTTATAAQDCWDKKASVCGFEWCASCYQKHHAACAVEPCHACPQIGRRIGIRCGEESADEGCTCSEKSRDSRRSYWCGRRGPALSNASTKPAVGHTSAAWLWNPKTNRHILNNAQNRKRVGPATQAGVRGSWQLCMQLCRSMGERTPTPTD